MRSLADRAMSGLARLLVRIFFKSVEVEGAERLPAHGPVVVVANHLNGLVDGLLLIAMLDRYPRFLGKSTLFSIPPLWPFLKLAGVVPVYRVKDGAETERNGVTFQTSHKLLAAGGVVGVFPEGISHDESTLQPLRTGAARIALGAAFDDQVEGVVVVPVGLVYDAKARFRSRALVRIADARPVAPLGGLYRSDDRAAVRRLTDQLTESLRTVSPSYRSWEQAAVLGRIAEVAARDVAPSTVGSRQVELAEKERITRALAFTEDQGRDASRMARLRDAFDDYERDLALLGLADEQVVAAHEPGRYRLIVGWSLIKVLAALPFAAFGAVVHIVPYQLIKAVAARPTNEGVKATVKVLGCFLLFTLTYAALAFFSARRVGVVAGVAVLVLAPACGYVTVRLAERIKRVGGLIGGYRVVAARRGVVGSVLARRAGIVDLTRQLLGAATAQA